METEKKVKPILSNAQIEYLESTNIGTTALTDILKTRKEYLDECQLSKGWFPLDVHQLQVWPDKVMTVVECSDSRRIDGKLVVETIFYCHEIHRGSNSLPALILHYMTEKKLGNNSSALVYGMVRALELDKEIENQDHL